MSLARVPEVRTGIPDGRQGLPAVGPLRPCPGLSRGLMLLPDQLGQSSDVRCSVLTRNGWPGQSGADDPQATLRVRWMQPSIRLNGRAKPHGEHWYDCICLGSRCLGWRVTAFDTC